MDTRIDFLYLSEQDTLAAGVNDSEKCVETLSDVFKLLAQGDYLMGGPHHNSHGMPIVFPKETPFPNMPVAGPDRRFVAMPAYLGGRFDVCGLKWYGSNAANPEKGQPRSILTVNLNDKDTGAPLCFMSANLLSAARTGAVPAVAASRLARKDSKVLAIIGCGPINKSCFRHIMTQLKGIEKVYCYDLFIEKAQAVADIARETYGIEGIASTTLEETLKDADVATICASRVKPLYIDSKWVKKGATLLISGSTAGDDDLWLNSKVVYDHIALQETYVAEAIESGDKEAYYKTIIGGPLFSLIDAGKLPPLKESTSIGMILNGDAEGRTSDDDNYVFITCGMPVYDVAWAYDVYQNALEKGIGTKLNLWDVPEL